MLSWRNSGLNPTAGSADKPGMGIPPHSRPHRIGLILTGGGARAAYQVGVLRAIASLMPRDTRNPFPIICGTSAGAINAVGLASQAHDFRLAVARMLMIWRNLGVRDVYRAGPVQMLRTLLRWIASLINSRWARQGSISLLDNSPLARLLSRHVDFGGIGRSIDCGALDAVCVTASAFAVEHSLSFYEGHEGCVPWRRARRMGVPTQLNVDHVMASSAIPFVFAPVKLEQGYCGDGSMQQLAPFSPALHLGATRILAISVARTRQSPEHHIPGSTPPTLAQIAGFLLNCVFIDSMETDLERLHRVNRTVSALPQSPASGEALRPVETLVLAPSRPLEPLAVRHARRLPASVRFLLRCLGGTRRSGATLLTYLLFERPYCRELIDLGFRDTLARRDELLQFLGWLPQTEHADGTQQTETSRA